jgi:hypothetical protein
MPYVRRSRARTPLGDCCTRSAFGQLDAGESTAALTPEVEGGARLPLGQLFAVSVAAGLTVFVVSRFLGKDR